MNSATQIAQSRAAGRTTCAVMPVGEERVTSARTVDSIVEAHGFRGLDDGWMTISAADAHAIVAALLHRDLAHQTEIMPLSRAATLATQFLDLAPEPHTYFTNGDWSIGEGSTQIELHSWDPISEESFDSGVVCVGEGVAAIFWVEDEE